MRTMVIIALLGLASLAPALAQLSPSLPSPSPQWTALAGDCTIFKDSAPADGPAKKSCSRCQWQCLTDSICLSMTFNGVEYLKADLVTFDCADPALGDYVDPYFTMVRDGNIAGLCVLLDDLGNVIDTQEQGCQECAHQCYYWATCAGMVYNYNTIVSKGPGMLESCPVEP